jgi:hypothetical protein
MGKLSEAASRIKAKKAAHDAMADDWNARMNAIDKTEARVKPMVEQVISERVADLAGLEADMRELSNFPTQDAEPSPKQPIASGVEHLGEGQPMTVNIPRSDLLPKVTGVVVKPGPTPAEPPMPKAPQLRIDSSTGDPIR